MHPTLGATPIDPVFETELEFLDQLLSEDDRVGRRFIHAPLEGFWIEVLNEKRKCLVYDLYGISLNDVSWPMSMVKRLAKDCLQALEYLHSKGVCHGSMFSNDFAQFQ